MTTKIADLKLMKCGDAIIDAQGLEWLVVDEYVACQGEEFSFLMQNPEGEVVEVFFEEVPGDIIVSSKNRVIFQELDPNKIIIQKAPQI